MNWCCDAFRARASNTREDGLVIYAIPPKPLQGEPQFGFATRVIRAEQVPQLRAAVGNIPGLTNIKLAGASRLRFCPWCGVCLVEHYRSSYQEFAHEDLLREFEIV